jgi:hypothetical protein
MSHYHDLITGLPETEEASESFVETDPVFEAWLLATPPLYSEVDPAFSAWLLATPPAYPVMLIWEQTSLLQALYIFLLQYLLS